MESMDIRLTHRQVYGLNEGQAVFCLLRAIKTSVLLANIAQPLRGRFLCFQ